MSCGLTEEALFILHRLYTSRNFTSSAGYHSDKLKSLYQNRFKGRKYKKFDAAIKLLQNEGYITEIRKKESKYYISDIPRPFLHLTVMDIMWLAEEIDNYILQKFFITSDKTIYHTLQATCIYRSMRTARDRIN